MSVNSDFREVMQALAVQHSMCLVNDCCYDFTKAIEEFFS